MIGGGGGGGGIMRAVCVGSAFVCVLCAKPMVGTNRTQNAASSWILLISVPFAPWPPRYKAGDSLLCQTTDFSRSSKLTILSHLIA